jgi:hypothetical protein
MIRFPHSNYIVLAIALCAPVAHAQPVASPAPSAPTLPPVQLPAQQPSLPSLPDAIITPAAAATPELPINPPTTSNTPKLSMGSSTLTIFFTPEQWQALQQTLEVYESTAKTGSTQQEDFHIDLIEAPKIVEPDSYPVFYLSSIVYRAPNDWSLWVSGHKITSQKNTSNLQVLSVSPNMATFSWTPSFSEALSKRWNDKQFAPVAPVKNKLTNPSSFSYNQSSGVVTFSLQPNQSFVAGYMNTFEGYVESPKLEKINAPATADTGFTSSSPTTGKPLSATDKALQQPTSIVDKVNLDVSGSRKAIDESLKNAPK